MTNQPKRQIRRTLLSVFLALPAPLFAQTPSPSVSLPVGTQLPVAIPQHLPMKAGESIRAELLYPVYADNQLVLPARTVVTGTVVALVPNHSLRVHARLGGDFTPFHTPIVRFDSIVLASGVTVPIETGPVTDGAPIYRLVAPPPVKGGLFAHLFAQGKAAIKDRIAVVTGPDKADRLRLLFYRQLPFHPERIAKSTAWTAELSAPVNLPMAGQAPLETASLASDATPTWIVQAYLTSPISSETSKAGEAISATVAEPILNSDGSVALPQGALLTGEVTQARRARRFSRSGELRFSFRQLQLPNQQAQAVRATITGADSPSAAQLAMDSEGQVKPKPTDKLAVPLILLALAARPLDRDHNDNMLGKDSLASNSLGLVGFLIGTAAQHPNIAAGFGYYGAAVSIYQRIFARGKAVAFARDTRVVIQTTPTRSSALKPTR